MLTLAEALNAHATAVNNLADALRQQARQNVAGLTHTGSAPADAVTADAQSGAVSQGEPEAPKPRGRPRKNAEDKGSSPTTSEAAPSTQSETPAASSDRTYEDIRVLTLKVSDAKGRDAAVKLLGSYKAITGQPAKKASEVQPEDYDNFWEEGNALLEAGDDSLE